MQTTVPNLRRKGGVKKRLMMMKRNANAASHGVGALRRGLKSSPRKDLALLARILFMGDFGVVEKILYDLTTLSLGTTKECNLNEMPMVKPFMNSFEDLSMTRDASQDNDNEVSGKQLGKFTKKRRSLEKRNGVKPR